MGRTPQLAGGQADELRVLVQTFVRSFGLLSQTETPCGQPIGISHAHALMFLLGAADGASCPTQQELGAALSIDKSNVTRLCRRMEELGHLEQVRCEEDGRARRLKLTTRGTKMARDVIATSRARFEAIMAQVDPGVRPQLLASLACLIGAVRKVAAPEEEEPELERRAPPTRVRSRAAQTKGARGRARR